MSQVVKIAGVQMDVAFADPAANLATMSARLEEASTEGAKLTVFPECALTGYCFESREEALPYAQAVPGDATKQLGEVCRRLGVYTVFGMLEADGDRLFNSCVLVGPDDVIANYRKIHLPFLGIDQFTDPGDRPFEIASVEDLRVGMNICYDGSFPESARVMTLAGADLIVLPTNWPPGADTFADYAINCRAMENTIYYMAVNRVGTERGFRFIGKSRICDPHGYNLAFAPDEEETILYAEIDPGRARKKHLVRVPNKHEINRIRDRRPEMYQAICAPKSETS